MRPSGVANLPGDYVVVVVRLDEHRARVGLRELHRTRLRVGEGAALHRHHRACTLDREAAFEGRAFRHDHCAWEAEGPGSHGDR